MMRLLPLIDAATILGGLVIGVSQYDGGSLPLALYMVALALLLIVSFYPLTAMIAAGPAGRSTPRPLNQVGGMRYLATPLAFAAVPIRFIAALLVLAAALNSGAVGAIVFAILWSYLLAWSCAALHALVAAPPCSPFVWPLLTLLQPLRLLRAPDRFFKSGAFPIVMVIALAALFALLRIDTTLVPLLASIPVLLLVIPRAVGWLRAEANDWRWISAWHNQSVETLSCEQLLVALSELRRSASAARFLSEGASGACSSRRTRLRSSFTTCCDSASGVDGISMRSRRAHRSSSTSLRGGAR